MRAGGPTLPRQRLARILRGLREKDGRSAAAIATLIGWSEATLNRLETGKKIRPQARDVRLLLDTYEVTDPGRREEILGLTRETGGRGWWHPYQSVMSDAYATYVGLEAETKKILNYESDVVPGLLQTEGYFRALMAARSPHTPSEVVDQLAAVRVLRQQLLTAEDPVRLWVVIGEGALHRIVGGPEVMAEQLEHLRKAAELPHVTVQIAPFTAGALPTGGPFSILTFRDRELDPETVYLESLGGDTYVTEEGQVAVYIQRYDHLIELSTKYEETLTTLAALSRQMTTDGNHTA